MLRSFFTRRRKRQAIAEGMLSVLDFQPIIDSQKPGFTTERANRKATKIRSLLHESPPQHQIIGLLEHLQEKYPDAQATVKQVAGKKIIEIVIAEVHHSGQSEKVIEIVLNP